MVAGDEGQDSSVCVVCTKAVSGSPVSVHASLVAQNGSIHNQMGQVVGAEEVTEACRASQVVCSGCLRLLLNIVNLECKVILLKNEFRATFQRGAESRRVILKGRHMFHGKQDAVGEGGKLQDGEWDSAHFGQCEKPEKIERFFDNIPPAKDTPQKVWSPVKHEAVNIDDVTMDSQPHTEGLDTELDFDSSQELRNLLPAHCLLGSVASFSSQSEAEDLRNVMKRSDSDTSMQDYPDSPPDTVNISVCATEDAGSPDGDACSTDMLQRNQGNKCLRPELNEACADSGSDGSIMKPAQGRGRRPRGKQQHNTWHPRGQRHKRRKSDTASENMEMKTEMEDGWVREGASQPDDLKTCELCGARFCDDKKLARHRNEMHSSVYCHVCHWCSDTCYREKAKLTQHLRRIHKIIAHQCLGCDHQAVSQNALDQHIISQHPESRFFECHICHKAFRTYRYLHIVHIKRCHFGLPIKYSCEKCHKGFVDKSSFENHKVTHSEARNFTCEYCGARFLTPYALKAHVNTHTQEKKYVCDDCGSEFLRMCNLCAHRKRFHSSDDVKLVCEICGKSMVTRKDLRRHQMTQHSKVKPFNCTQCKRSYAAKESLKSHLRTHTGEKPYVCACGKAFHKSNVLRRHQRCVHEGDDFQQDTVTVQEVNSSVQVGGDDLEQEEPMVVITLKECNPPAVYAVQSTSPHLEEILVSNEASSQSQSETPLVTTEDPSLPMLQPSLSDLSRGRLAISTPILFTSLSAVQHHPDPMVQDPAFSTHVTTIDSDLSMQPGSTSFQRTHNSSEPVSVKEDDPLATLSPAAACTDASPQLIQLPNLHDSSVASWPSPAL